MVQEIKVPELGESITEGVIVAWLQDDGAIVESGAPLLELETDKVTTEIVAPVAGRLAIVVPAEATVTVGQVVATIDPDAAAVATGGGEALTSPGSEPEAPPLEPPAGMARAAAKLADIEAGHAADLSPAVRRLVTEHHLSPEEVAATGPGGRITKDDVLRHLAADSEPDSAAPKQAPPPRDHGGARQTRRRMSKLRQRVAERLVNAQQTAAILTTFNEADMSSVMDWRARHKEEFKQRHGVGLGFMSFFVKATVDALMRVPQLNAQIDGDEIVDNHFYDIGVAVGTEQGLLVPVIRDCDRLDFAEIERGIADVARRARDKKITLEELSGGCFTISNGGVYGSMLSTPILNPPQSGILGLHAIKKRPVVVDDAIVIRPMMYLALSYDHRIVDGAEAVTFLKRIVECIEDPERTLLNV